MLPTISSFQLTLNTTISLHWSARIATFVQEWQRRLQTTEVSGAQAEEHMIEAAWMVLSAIEQLDDRTAQVLTDLYRLNGQLPAPTDKLLVGSLELRVDERQVAVSRQGDNEQVVITYCLDIVRYRYGSQQAEVSKSVPVSHSLQSSIHMITSQYLGTGQIEIAPNLSVYLVWSERMSEAMEKRYWAVKYQWSAENENLRKQYETWYYSRNAAQEQIRQMFAVTATLPVAGDHLMVGGESGYTNEALRVEKRTVFSTLDSDGVLFVYEVCGEDVEMEELEEYREGDLVEEDE